MKNFKIALIIGISFFSSLAFADLKYECGYMSVSLSDNQGSLTVRSGEWSAEYRVSKTNSSEFNAVRDQSFDSDLGATSVSVSQSMLAGEDKTSITLVGGEDGGTTLCARDR